MRKISLISKSIALIVWLLLLTNDLLGQTKTEIESLESEINNLYGVEKLKTLNKLTRYYKNRERKKEQKYGKQAVQLAESIFTIDNVLVNETERSEKITAYYQLGLCYFDQDKYSLAEENLIKAIGEAVITGDSVTTFASQKLLKKISESEDTKGFFKKKIKPLNLGNKINNTSSNLKISSILAIAKMNEKNKNYDKAIENYKTVISLYRNIGEAKKIAETQVKVAELYKLKGQQKESIAFYQMASGNFEKLKDTISLASSRSELKSLYNKKKDKIEDQVSESLEENQTDDEMIKSMDRYIKLSEEFEERKDYIQSLKYYKQYIELKASFEGKKIKERADSVELMTQSQQIMILEQENNLNEVNLIGKTLELERQEKFRNGLILGAIVLLIMLVVFYKLFTSKKKSHDELTITYESLNNIRKQLAIAEQNIKKLLGQQVSEDIATALIANEPEKGNIQKYVCIMFLDIRDFTPFASTRTPEEVIQYQNDVFGFMIEIIEKHNGVINQFMGDGFMATFGAPVSYDNDTQNAFAAAMEIVAVVNEKSKKGVIPKTRIGIGLHAGNVVAGNVGTDLRKQYSITGTTVITAARIEQLNKKHISQLLVSEEVVNKIKSTDSLKEVEIFEEELKGLDHPIKIYKIL